MRGKHWVLLLSFVILAAVAVLSASLHEVHFEPGRAASFPQEASGGEGPKLNVMETIRSTPLWKLLLFWLAFAINMIVFFWVLPAEVRKRILRQVLGLVLGSLAVVVALRYGLMDLPFLHTEPAPRLTPIPGGAGSGAPMPSFQPPPVASWWLFLISFFVLAAVLLLTWLAWRWWLRPARGGLSDLDAIRRIAASSLEDLAAGREWSDVIIQSYARMNQAVRASRGLERPEAATPREFAQRLEQAGLPAQAVERLTRLFESARYGAGASSPGDIREAVACLNSILQACGQAQ